MIASGIEITLRTLLRSSNPAATDLLVRAVESDHAGLRVGAVRALALRADPAGHRALVERRDELPADARAALLDVPVNAPLAGSLPGMIMPAKPSLAKRGAETAVAWGAIDTLPAIVEAALWPGEHAAEFAGCALRLAERLERAVRDYDPSVSKGDGPRPVDPAFARRAAVNALTASLERYEDDSPHELLTALLLLTPRDEPALWTVLRNASHPAHEALLAELRTSRSRGALGLLAHALVDHRTPQEALQVATERSDRTSLETLLSFIERPIGARIRENFQRIDSLAWLHRRAVEVIDKLSGPSQATAIELAAASHASRRELAAAIIRLIRYGEPEGRLAAARAIERLPDHLAGDALDAAVERNDPAVLAVIAPMLRRASRPHGVGQLVEMLDDSEAIVREAAQKSLRELSFANFRGLVEDIPSDARQRLGQLVGKADPLAKPTLQAELSSGAVGRRIEALQMIELLALIGRMSAEIAPLLGDSDAGVRAEAARLLGDAEPTEEMVGLLEEALADRSGAVRREAERSLLSLGETQPAAQETTG